MRCVVLAALVAVAPALAQPGSGNDSYADSVAVRTVRYRGGVAEARTLNEAGCHAEAADRYATAFAEYRVPDYGDLYNAACAAALAGETGRAYGLLHRAIEAGWENDRLMDNDADLAALRAYDVLWAEAHAALDAALRQRYGERLDPALRAELLDVFQADQAGRQQLEALRRVHGWPIPDSIAGPLWQEVERTDALNLVRLERIVADRGWPRISEVGRPAANAAFLVVQHSPLEVQERYLPMLQAAVEVGEGRAADLAYLTDRIRIRKDQPQLYGSQVCSDAAGAMVFCPIEDEANVDARRAAVGLEPLAAYARMIGFEYRAPSQEGS